MGYRRRSSEAPAGRAVAALLALAAASTSLFLAAAASDGGGSWETGHATFYGNNNPAESQKGACAYDVNRHGYGDMTAALSTALFDGGLACGGCYEVRCYDSSEWCLPGTAVTVTATNLCPPSGWCSSPNRHFDLNMPAFLKIAKYKAGIVPVQFRRVPCRKSGGIKFEIGGHKYFITVLVHNVGGAGDVREVAVKGASGSGWIALTRDWGQIWVAHEASLVGQELSFKVTAGDGKAVVSDGAAPASWQFGKTYEGKQF